MIGQRELLHRQWTAQTDRRNESHVSERLCDILAHRRLSASHWSTVRSARPINGLWTRSEYFCQVSKHCSEWTFSSGFRWFLQSRRGHHFSAIKSTRDFWPSTGPRQEGDSSKNIGSIIRHITHVIRPIFCAGLSRSPLTRSLYRVYHAQRTCNRSAGGQHRGWTVRKARTCRKTPQVDTTMVPILAV